MDIDSPGFLLNFSKPDRQTDRQTEAADGAHQWARKMGRRPWRAIDMQVSWRKSTLTRGQTSLDPAFVCGQASEEGSAGSGSGRQRLPGLMEGSMSVFALRRRVLATERTEIALRRFSLDARRRAFVSSSADCADLAPTMGVKESPG